MKIFIKILVLPLISNLTFATETLTEEEKAVWELELAYYEYAKSNDQEGFLSLFDEKVVGWPALDKAPKSKDSVSLWIQQVHADPTLIWNYELTRLAIETFGDIVVVHYLLRDYFASVQTGAEVISSLYKISHTWQRNEGKWQIISGMGGIAPE